MITSTNKPAAAKKKGSAAGSRILVFGGLATLFAVCAGMATLLLSKDSKNEENAEEPMTRRIARLSPAKMVPRPEKPEVKDYKNIDNIQLRRLPVSETNNLTEAQVNYWKMFHPWPPPDANQPKAIKGRYRIFNNKVDNEIAFVVSVEPGTMVLGNRSVGPDFERRFLKSIENPIIINEDDSIYVKELKRAVIDAKLELKEAYDRGEDIGEIMDEARDELQRMARYKAQMEKEIVAMLSRGEVTAQDSEDMIKAMNIMLEKKGIGLIELNSMSRIALKYQNLLRKDAEQ